MAAWSQRLQLVPQAASTLRRSTFPLRTQYYNMQRNIGQGCLALFKKVLLDGAQHHRKILPKPRRSTAEYGWISISSQP
jgi:hypothetical protein